MKKAISKYVNNQTKTYQWHLNVQFGSCEMYLSPDYTLHAFKWLGILSMLKRLLFRCVSFNPLLFQVFRMILNNGMENFLNVFALFSAFFILFPLLLHALSPVRYPPSPLSQFSPLLPINHSIASDIFCRFHLEKTFQIVTKNVCRLCTKNVAY